MRAQGARSVSTGPRRAHGPQAGLLAAKVRYEKGQTDESRAALAWVVENAVDDEYRALARLRLAGVLLDAKQYDDALKQLDPVAQGPFAALAADRRGDILQAQGKTAEAKAAYQQAWKAMDEKVEYRRLVDAKLTALGAAPTAAAASAAAGAAK